MGKKQFTFDKPVGIYEGLSRTEKLDKIRALIKNKVIPPWMDPYFCLRKPNQQDEDKKTSKVREEMRQRAQKKKDFRDWYMSRDDGQHAARRAELKEKADVKKEIFAYDMDIPQRQVELQAVLECDRERELSELEKIYSSQPTSLDLKKLKIKKLNARHLKEQEEMLAQLYERVWHESTNAEPLRCWEFNTHRRQADADQAEIMFFQRLEELDDAEVDYYYHLVEQDRIRRERAKLDQEAQDLLDLELRGQEMIRSQIREHDAAKEELRKKKCADQEERLVEAEKMKYEDFVQRQEEQVAYQKRREILQNQRVNNRMALARKEELKKEAENIRQWNAQMKADQEAAVIMERKKKQILYNQYLEGEKYNIAMVEMTKNTAHEEFAKIVQKEQNEDHLLTFLALTKTRQSQQLRCNKELAKQVQRKQCEMAQEEAEKAKDRAVEIQNYEDFLREEKTKAEKLRNKGRINTAFLVQQIQDKKDHELQLKTDSKNFFKYLRSQRDCEDQHIQELSKALAEKC